MDSADRVVKQTEKRRAAIQQKVHPALPEMFKIVREATKAWKALKKADRTSERLEKIQVQLNEKLESIQRRYSGPVQAPKGTFAVEVVYSEYTLASESEGAAVAEYLHWHRHKTPLTRDLQDMEAKDQGASTRVQRTFQDYEILRCGSGHVKPFKGGTSGTDHWDFFVIGWGLGLEKLSLEELADFANSYCICESREHDPENLKQQRLRFKKALKNAMEPAAPREPQP